MKKLFVFVTVGILFCACDSKNNDPNIAAIPFLEAARTQMQNKNFQAAKDSILRMRSLHPTALKARQQGILVMDSIELLEAQHEITNLYEELRIEEHKLDSISKKNNRGKNSPYYDQKNKVFYLRQNIDEVNAKIKFFIRKIEEDQKF